MAPQGEWIAVIAETIFNDNRIESEGNTIGRMYDDDDARLTSAAPDLLAACKAFVEAYEKSQLKKTDVALTLAKAAIAKAQPNKAS